MRVKRNIFSFFIYIILPFISLIVLIGLIAFVRWFFSGWEEIEKENAYEHIMNCQNPYAFWQGVDGKSCDEARKTYHEYTEEEWREEKKILVSLGRITEKDYLYDEFKKEIELEREQ
jgi:hypothetical protein